MLQRWLGHADMKTTAIYAQAVGRKNGRSRQGCGR
nr:hypothetical protein [Roseibium album]